MIYKTLEVLRQYFMSKDRDNTIAGDIVPDLAGARSLGTSSKPFKEIHALSIVGTPTSTSIASHVLATTSGLGAYHTVSGLTAGQFLRATGATTAAFQTIQSSDLPSHTHNHDTDLTGVSADDHHNQVHELASTTGLGSDHTVSGLTSGQVLKATGNTTAKFMQLSHTELSDLTTGDPHTQYFKLGGRSGGQTAYGGTVSGNDLTLYSNIYNDGKIYLGDYSVYDENNDRLGIQTTGPAYPLEIAADVSETTLARGIYVSLSNAGSGGSSLDIRGIFAEIDGTGTTADKVYGGYFKGNVQTGETTNDLYGLYGYAVVTGGAATNVYGVYAAGSGGTNNYGIYATASGGTAYAGYFSGNTHIIGDITLTGTVDGVDLAAFKTTYDAHDHSAGNPTQVDHANLTNVTANQHHSQSHVLATTSGLGADHTVSGLMAGQYLRATGATTAAFQTIQASDLPGSFSGFAAPTAQVGLTAISGTATTAMRSDAAPSLDQSISPTWTGMHTFQRTSEQVRIGYDASNYASFTVSSGGNLTIAPTGDLVFDPIGNDILPDANYDLNLGSASKKYLTLNAAELMVGTIVASQTLATIGGRIVVAPTGKMASDSSSWPGATLLTEDSQTRLTEDGQERVFDGCDTVTVDTNAFGVGDILYAESEGKVEFFQVIGGPTGTGPYTYVLTRDLDGTGGNTWYAGDALVNTGTTGDGFIDIYSNSGISSGTGPAIVGDVRNSTTYNDWTEHWAIGNLNGLYGYGTDTYGVGLGKYGSANYMTIEATNGIRFFNSAGTTLGQLTGSVWTLGDTANEHIKISTSGTEIYDGATLLASYGTSTVLYDTGSVARLTLSTTGITVGDTANEHVVIDSSGMTVYDASTTLANFGATVTVGEVGTGKSNVYITAGELQLRNDTDAKITLDASGDVTLAGTLDIGTSGVLKSGATGYDNGTGYWLEYNAGTPRFFIGDSTGNKLLWDGSTLSYTGGLAGGQFDGVLSISASGGIYQGIGTFSSPDTGLKIYNSSGVGLLELWGGGTKQVYMDTSGQLVAGNGGVALNSNGIDLTPASTAYVQWDGGTDGLATMTAWLNLTPTPDAYTLYQSVSTVSSPYSYNANIWLETTSSSGSASLRVDADSSAVTFECDANPYVADSYNLGTASKRWKDIHYSGDVKPYRNSTTYTGYVFVPLTSPLTSTNWDGDAYSTTSKTLIDLSADFGAPAGIKAILIGIAVRDSGAATQECWMRLGPSATIDGLGIECQKDNTRWQMASMVIPCDSNGDVYYEIQASGTNTFEVWISIWGYHL